MGRKLRLLASFGIVAALIWGTFFGQDDHFPFGPFRMFSTRNRPDGQVWAPKIDGITVTGDVVQIPLSPHDSGLKRAEIEGQLARFLDDPALLRHVLAAFERINPEAPRVLELRLYRRIFQLHDARPVAYREELQATWRRP